METDTLDLAAACNTAVAVAQEAGHILVDRFGTVAARRKDDGTLVTEADHAADDAITAALQSHFPHHAVLSEERNTHYAPASRYTWVIDPLDGTTNYARGLPLFGVSIALLVDGEPVLGVLDFPYLHETYAAMLDHGAFCNAVQIWTDPTTLPDDQHLFMQCTRTARRFRIRSPLKTRVLGSAAYHLVCVANGTALAAIEATPKIWDLAAAYLILHEAGGIAHPLRGQADLFPLEAAARDYKTVAMPILAATNQACYEQVRAGIEFR